MGVEFFKKSGKSRVSNAYREGDCLLNSGSNTEEPECNADYYQMYFWKQGRFVECSSNHPEDTKTDSGKVNKASGYNNRSRSNNRYSYNNNARKSMKEWEKDILGQFENWLEREEQAWKERFSGGNGFTTDWGNMSSYKPKMSYYYGY